MNTKTRLGPDEALERYLQDARQKGVPTKQLTMARHYLRHLLTALKEETPDRHGYRRATEEVARIFPQREFLDAVREFFPYWAGEPPPRPSAEPSSATPPSPATPAAAANPPVTVTRLSPPSPSLGSGLADSLQRMEIDPWAKATVAGLERQLLQFRSLHRYGEALRKLGLDEKNSLLRMRLIKLLLFTIRDAPQNTESYRGGVDKVLAMIPNQEHWHVFVGLAREFFHFLADAPDAADKVQLQLDTSVLRELIGQ
ncbi:hypothetical protein [Chitinimonas lacunae]|uniref:Uncharacterized protein n=1 Tax=Chitinimonas lacunae TaxID=1963018 RepID=A0ABV8MLD8_9NEIS